MAGQREKWQRWLLLLVLCISIIFSRNYIDCQAAPVVHHLMITSDTHMYKIAVPQSEEPKVFISGGNKMAAVFVDSLRGRVYWSDHGKHTINRAALDGSDQKIIVNPGYVGCFLYDNSLTNVVCTLNISSPMKCVNKCVTDKGHSVGGVLNGNTCFCGKQILNASRQPDAECNMPCTGDKNQNCGSTFQLSVYNKTHFVVRGLAVDTETNKIYFTHMAVVEIMNPDGSGRTRVIEHSVEVRTYGIAVDIADRLLFHSTQNPPRVYKSLLDGTEAVEIVSSDVHTPWGVAIDYNHRRICWGDSGKNYVKCTDYDGRNPKQRDTDVSVRYVALAGISDVQDDSLYFAQSKHNRSSVSSCRLNLTNCDNIGNGEFSITGISVFPDDAKNWALGKKALQSSTLNNHKASRAVDGSRTAHRLHQNSCAQTNEEKRPWWTVNFGKVIHVQKVVIYNVDNCNDRCLHDFDIVIGHDDGTHKPCGLRRNNITNISSKTFYCLSGVTGSTLNITILAEATSLVVCEVAVYGYFTACWSNPCENGGTCERLGDSHNCSCTANYTGSNCESK